MSGLLAALMPALGQLFGQRQTLGGHAPTNVAEANTPGMTGGIGMGMPATPTVGPMPGANPGHGVGGALANAVGSLTAPRPQGPAPTAPEQFMLPMQGWGSRGPVAHNLPLMQVAKFWQ